MNSRENMADEQGLELSAKLYNRILADLASMDAMASMGYGVACTARPTHEPLLDEGFSDWYYENYTMGNRR